MTLNEKDEKRLHGYSDSERTKQTFSDQDIFGALRTANHAVDSSKALTRNQYQEHYESEGGPHPHTIIRRFGRWSVALDRAGLPSAGRAKYQGRTTKADCISGLLAARAELGHLASVGEYQRLWEEKLRAEGHPSAGTIRVNFDKWRTANEEAARYIDTIPCATCGEPVQSKVDSVSHCDDCLQQV